MDGWFWPKLPDVSDLPRPKRKRKKKWIKPGRLGPQKSGSESSSDEEEKIELTALLREHGASDDYPEWSKVCT